METFLHQLQFVEARTQGNFILKPHDPLSYVVRSQSRITSHSWNDKDELEFTSMLKTELDKVHDFQKQKVYPSSIGSSS